MGAASYVGRIGGLAAALGVGIGIFLAAGTASADSDETSSKTTSSESSETSTSKSDHDTDAKQTATDTKSATRDDDDADSLSEDAESSDDTPDSEDADSLSKDPEDAQDPEDTEDSKSAAEPSDDTYDDARPDDTDTNTKTDESDEDEPSAADVAALAVTSTDHAVTKVSTATTPDPSSNAPTAALLPAADPIPYAPVVDLDEGVITGENTAISLDPLTYTVIRNPSAGGKVSLDSTSGDFTFLPYLTPSRPVENEKFSVLVAEQTAFTQALQNIEIVKTIAPRIIVVLQQVPIVKDVLSPLIGRAQRFDVIIDVGQYVGEDKAPIAFTTRIRSFDGTRISVNYFPAIGLGIDDEAPLILNGPSLATAGYTNLQQTSTVAGLVPGISQIREAGYNVITWDPRGEFASGGRMHLDSELFEARDVSAIIDWATQLPGTAVEPDGDPLVGMVGGSYGGGIQLTSAGIDPRIDAIAPGIAWNSLETALYPNHSFKTSWASLLALSLALTGSRPVPEIYAGIITGVLTGFLTPGQQRFLSENSPSTVVGDITAPTLFLQGTVDGLFVLQQAIANAEALDSDVPVRMIWYCGGHGYCLDLNPQQSADQYGYLNAEILGWMDTYVKNKGLPNQEAAPTFTWVDQRGQWFAAQSLPTKDSDFFSEDDIEVSGAGGLLPVVPILGGSGPQTQAPFPLSLPAAAESQHAIELTIPNQGTTADTPIHIVGPPTVTLTYSGLGNSRDIYVQLVDNTTHRVLGNLVTPVPVILDGRQRDVTINLENIAYTMSDPGDSLTLQIVSSATAYEDFTSFGVVNVSNVVVSLPTAAVAEPVTLPHVPLPPTGTTGTPSVEDLLTGAAAR